MHRVDVQAVAGKYCLTMAEGGTLHKVLLPLLRRGEAVELNFEGVSMYASPFFNAAIGQLVKDISREDVGRLLSVRGLSSDGILVLRRSLDNATLYYAEQRVRDAWDTSTTNP